MAWCGRVWRDVTECGVVWCSIFYHPIPFICISSLFQSLSSHSLHLSYFQPFLPLLPSISSLKSFRFLFPFSFPFVLILPLSSVSFPSLPSLSNLYSVTFPIFSLSHLDCSPFLSYFSIPFSFSPKLSVSPPLPSFFI